MHFEIPSRKGWIIPIQKKSKWMFWRVECCLFAGFIFGSNGGSGFYKGSRTLRVVYLFGRISADQAKKWGKKCSTGQRFICTEVTSYKIHILRNLVGEAIIINWFIIDLVMLRNINLHIWNTKGLYESRIIKLCYFKNQLVFYLASWNSELKTVRLNVICT